MLNWVLKFSLNVWFHIKHSEVSLYMLVKVLNVVLLLLCVPKFLYNSFPGDGQMVVASLLDLAKSSLFRVEQQWKKYF